LSVGWGGGGLLMNTLFTGWKWLVGWTLLDIIDLMDTRQALG
jgi:hypothetical protein